jgi:hypothetical protein
MANTALDFRSHYLPKATLMAKDAVTNVRCTMYFSESSSKGNRNAIAETVQEQDYYNQKVSVTASTRTFDDFRITQETAELAPEGTLAAKKYCRLH